MVKGTLFYNPKDKQHIQIQKLLTDKNLTVTLQDATSRQVSMFLYHDMTIDTLPALYLYHNSKYRLYQGFDKIKAALSKI